MGTQKDKNSIPPAKLALYAQLVATNPEIERKGATMPYTSLNGNMFSFLDQHGDLGLRLPKEQREAFILQHKTRLCEAHGAVLKEYVLVPEDLFGDLEAMKKYLQMSFEYAKTLKPKKK